MLRVGDEVIVLPSGARSHVDAIEGAEGAVEEAYPPMSVTVRLADDIDISRGDMICRPRNQPAVVRRFDAMISWMADRPARAGNRYVLKHTTRTVRADIEALHYRIDVTSLHREEGVEALGLNDIGRITMRASSPLFLDEYARNRSTGSFVLIDETTNDTVGAGMVVERHAVDTAAPVGTPPRSTNVVWQEGALSRSRRWASLDSAGATIWFTGLPSSGKSTIAGAVEERLVADGINAYLLDGDNLRHGLNGDLGFDASARSENVRRAGEAARLFADSGTIALVSLVSPYTRDRDAVRETHHRDELPFLEVFVDTPVEECERRDPKGLYARARAGRDPRLHRSRRSVRAAAGPGSGDRRRHRVDRGRRGAGARGAAVAAGRLGATLSARAFFGASQSAADRITKTGNARPPPNLRSGRRSATADPPRRRACAARRASPRSPGR